MEVLFINSDNFNKFLSILSKEFDVYVPVKFPAPEAQEKKYLHFEKFNPSLLDKILIIKALVYDHVKPG